MQEERAWRWPCLHGTAVLSNGRGGRKAKSWPAVARHRVAGSRELCPDLAPPAAGRGSNVGAPPAAELRAWSQPQPHQRKHWDWQESSLCRSSMSGVSQRLVRGARREEAGRQCSQGSGCTLCSVRSCWSICARERGAVPTFLPCSEPDSWVLARKALCLFSLVSFI